MSPGSRREPEVRDRPCRALEIRREPRGRAACGFGGWVAWGPDPNPWTPHPAFPHIGDALQTHFRGHPRAEYGQQVVRNLCKDIGLGETTLWEIRHFRRALPILSTCKELGWSHIREVLRAPTQDQRLYYLRAAAEGSRTRTFTARVFWALLLTSSPHSLQSRHENPGLRRHLRHRWLRGR